MSDDLQNSNLQLAKDLIRFSLSRKEFHVRQPLTESPGKVQARNRDAEGIAGLLFEIPGITHLHIHPYSVSVLKAEMYEWNEITPAVEEALLPFMER